jgi:hypothetical protein
MFSPLTGNPELAESIFFQGRFTEGLEVPEDRDGEWNSVGCQPRAGEEEGDQSIDRTAVTGRPKLR